MRSHFEMIEMTGAKFGATTTVPTAAPTTSPTTTTTKAAAPAKGESGGDAGCDSSRTLAPKAKLYQSRDLVSTRLWNDLVFAFCRVQ